MLDRLAAYAHLVRIPIEPRLHGLTDGFMFPARYPPLFACRALGLQCAALACGGPIAPQCLAFLFIGVAIGSLLTRGTKIRVVRGDIDEVLLAKATFGVDARGHWLRQIDRDTGFLARQNFLTAVVPAIGNRLDGFRTNRYTRPFGHAR